VRNLLQTASAADIPALVSMRNAVHEDLASRFGNGYWTSGATERGALALMKRASVYVARVRGDLIASLSLTTRKPWAIDVAYFTPVGRPLYLIGMAVRPDMQRKGIGKRCLDEALRLAKRHPSDAIRLDAFDGEFGAGGFYAKCGFREVGRTSYRNHPLIYFERLI
jgi:GNAT superfamily N-acetyltransferase